MQATRNWEAETSAVYGAAGRKARILMHADVCCRTTVLVQKWSRKRSQSIQNFQGRAHPQTPLAVAYLSTYHSNPTTSHLMATAIYGNDIMADFQNCHTWYLQVVSLLSVCRKTWFLESVVMGWRRVPDHHCS